ncbi:MAG TPA: type II toxin-antitoxin system HigB family toxin [Nitrospiria bacterium]|nr:type II toxin-antitoxin system HigB family toxin [Nitrospiria bacterium]
MRILSRKILREFWEKHPDAEQPLQAWYHDVKHADWRSPANIKAVYRNASFVGQNRVVFNIKGNKYRLVVAVQYDFRIVFIRFIGTHKEYDAINAEKV